MVGEGLAILVLGDAFVLDARASLSNDLCARCLGVLERVEVILAAIVNIRDVVDTLVNGIAVFFLGTAFVLGTDERANVFDKLWVGGLACIKGDDLFRGGDCVIRAIDGVGVFGVTGTLTEGGAVFFLGRALGRPWASILEIVFSGGYGAVERNVIGIDFSGSSGTAIGRVGAVVGMGLEGIAILFFGRALCQLSSQGTGTAGSVDDLVLLGGWSVGPRFAALRWRRDKAHTILYVAAPFGIVTQSATVLVLVLALVCGSVRTG